MLAWHLNESPGGYVWGEVPDPVVGPDDVQIDVRASALNHMDLWLTTGLPKPPAFPHVSGNDVAGVVSAVGSSVTDWSVGDEVVVTGWRIGELYWGGMSQRANMKPDFVTKLPAGMSPRQAMVVGTAGLTAMLAVIALEDHGLAPGKGPVLVTGAAGGIGSAACRRLGVASPRIAVCGLNPHAGEHGLLGPEDVTIIAPARRNPSRTALSFPPAAATESPPMAPTTTAFLTACVITKSPAASTLEILLAAPMA
mgnify:CR=1 FL=1